MRPLIILALFSFTLINGCQNASKENTELEITTYSVDEIQYPDTSLRVPYAIQHEFIDNYFAPWQKEPKTLLAESDSLPGRDLSYLQTYLNDDEWYGENKKQHPKRLRQEIVSNVDTSSYPNFLKRGILVSHTDLRRLPTEKPGFDMYTKAGEGYPFDYFQETHLWANTPLLLVHTTIDRQWCYVISPIYKGWVAMRDVAIAGDDFVKAWSTGSYAVPLTDRLSLQSNASHYAINAKLGILMPYEESPIPSDQITVYYAKADEKQQAHLLTAQVDKSSLAFEDFALTEDHLKPLVEELLGRPYGWGGQNGNRDCSSTIRDLLSTFRIWLPRDSGDQLDVGNVQTLTGTAAEKIQYIREHGIPFLTILGLKGHTMLYVGLSDDGEPLILHSKWGLKTTYANPELAKYLSRYPIEGLHLAEDGNLLGRYIIGETLITSVNLGSGNPEITTPLIEDIYVMTNLLQP